MTAAMHQDTLNFVMISPLGELEIAMCGDALAGIRYLSGRKRAEKGGRPRGRAACRIESQLHRYFDDPHWRFDLGLILRGTPFQRRVWRLLTRIPSGRTLTYGEVARRLESGPRAVGGACRVNPVPIVVPCHRVIATNAIGGYCGNMQGKMLHAKRWLLQHEHFDHGEYKQ